MNKMNIRERIEKLVNNFDNVIIKQTLLISAMDKDWNVSKTYVDAFLLSDPIYDTKIHIKLLYNDSDEIEKAEIMIISRSSSLSITQDEGDVLQTYLFNLKDYPLVKALIQMIFARLTKSQQEG